MGVRRLYKGVLALSVALLLTACASKEDFFEDQGLVITPQGEISFATTVHNGDGDTLDFEEHADVAVSEEPVADREGFKTVSAVFECDISQVPEGYLPSSWQLAFDRYTGTSFEFYDPADADSEGAQPSAFTFDCNGKSVEIQMAYDMERNSEEGTITIIIDVTCPEWYDGTVFQIGYSDNSINEADQNWPYSERLYTIDELPGFDSNGHDYYYFSYKNS